MQNTVIHAAIDSVQSSKKQFVELAFPYGALKSALNQFIDSQTDYTKRAVDTSMSAMWNLSSLLISKSFYDECMKSVFNWYPIKKGE